MRTDAVIYLAYLDNRAWCIHYITKRKGTHSTFRFLGYHGLEADHPDLSWCSTDARHRIKKDL